MANKGYYLQDSSLTSNMVGLLSTTSGIGVAAGESDIFPSTALTGLNATTSAFNFVDSLSSFYVAQASDVIKLGIDVGYTATSITLVVDLLGYLI